MRWLVIPLLLVACGEAETARSPASGESGAEAATAANRDEWWTAATRTALGSERLLCPRELRGLLAAGRSRGLDTDGAWWTPKAKWAYERILMLDPDDVEANASVGRKTLQSLPGFESTWTRMLEAKVQNAAIEELLEQFQPWIEEGRPVFLGADEVEVVTASLRRASEHLDRMENDPEYAALQLSLERIPSQLRSYPSIRTRAGPFLVFFAARDLARIEGESAEAENERLKVLRAKYQAELDERCKVLPEMMADIAQLYPELAKRHALANDDFFFLWIFGDPEWYTDFLEQLHEIRPESAYRCGFFQKRDMWGYLFRPRKPEVVASAEEGEAVVARDVIDPESQLRETMCYIAAQQLLRHWGRDPADPFRNRLDGSRAYWLKEGWPAFLASRRVEKPMVGPALEEGWRFGREPPPLKRIVERESRLELFRYDEPDPPQGPGEPILNLGIRRHFTDLAWLLVRHLDQPPTRPKLEAYLLAQIEGTAPGTVDGFAAAFGLASEKAWRDLEDALYEPLDRGR